MSLISAQAMTKELALDLCTDETLRGHKIGIDAENTQADNKQSSIQTRKNSLQRAARSV